MIPAIIMQIDGSTTCTDVGTVNPGWITVNTDTAVAIIADTWAEITLSFIILPYHTVVYKELNQSYYTPPCP